MSDLGPLLAAVTDEWERALVIAQRAEIDPRTAGQRLSKLERQGLAVSSRTDSGLRLWRRGPKAPPLPSRDYELVRVSRELVERLVNDDSAPVVVMGIERHDDGTCDLILRNAGEEAA